MTLWLIKIFGGLQNGLRRKIPALAQVAFVWAGMRGVWFCLGWDAGSVVLFGLGCRECGFVWAGIKGVWFCLGWDEGSVVLFRLGCGECGFV